MDPSAMAAAAVASLTPFLVEGGKAVVKKVGDRVGDSVITLYDTLKAKLVRTPAQEALAELEQAPEDTDLQATMRVQLKKALSEDASFREELAVLLQSMESPQSGMSQKANTTGDNNVTTQILGSGNIIGPPSQKP